MAVYRIPTGRGVVSWRGEAGELQLCSAGDRVIDVDSLEKNLRSNTLRTTAPYPRLTSAVLCQAPSNVRCRARSSTCDQECIEVSAREHGPRLPSRLGPPNLGGDLRSTHELDFV